MTTMMSGGLLYFTNKPQTSTIYVVEKIEFTFRPNRNVVPVYVQYRIQYRRIYQRISCTHNKTAVLIGTVINY